MATTFIQRFEAMERSAKDRLAGLERLDSAADLTRFRERHGMRRDWHEPDEQGVTATAVGSSFDNAGFATEKQVILSVDSRPVAYINLATLLALACTGEKL